jgi:hypothetical protein
MQPFPKPLHPFKRDAGRSSVPFPHADLAVPIEEEHDFPPQLHFRTHSPFAAKLGLAATPFAAQVKPPRAGPQLPALRQPAPCATLRHPAPGDKRPIWPQCQAASLGGKLHRLQQAHAYPSREPFQRCRDFSF